MGYNVDFRGYSRMANSFTCLYCGDYVYPTDGSKEAECSCMQSKMKKII